MRCGSGARSVEIPIKITRAALSQDDRAAGGPIRADEGAHGGVARVYEADDIRIPKFY